MAAEVIANELGQTLHRIDLSSVVSKWVGETEKNLAAVQRCRRRERYPSSTRRTLFGKRTEVQ